MARIIIVFLSLATVADISSAGQVSISDVLTMLKRQSGPVAGASFQAGGSPASATNQQPSMFIQPSIFTDPSFSALSGGSQSPGSASNGTSPSGSNAGVSSPFLPSFLDPSKFSSTGQFSPNFSAGSGGNNTGLGVYPPGTSGTGAFPPGTSGNGGGLFPLTGSGAQGNSTGFSPSGMTSSGTNSSTGIQQSMYPNMFSNPNQFVG